MSYRLSLPEALRRADVGCLGATLLVLLTAGGALGLVAMVWWMIATKAHPSSCRKDQG